MSLKIGTRASRLALAQAAWVKDKIEACHPDLKVELVKIKTTGDRILNSPLSKIGGKGLFVKEIEEALIKGSIDLAVHSMKDVPAELPEDLCLSCFPKRETPQDAFISVKSKAMDKLPLGARIGTSSLRRSAQVLAFRPDLNIVPLRGNVDTRLKKLESGEADAIILASAGLLRLGLADRITDYVPTEHMLPAVGQGALGLEIRKIDKRTAELLAFINHKDTELSVRAERAVLRELGGGCQVPIAAYAQIRGEDINLDALVASVDGRRIIKDKIVGKTEDPEGAGVRLARRLLDSGAKQILDEI
ncbi:MAG: hydroxymethylbilane synthase [Deltaproteobacteria bacterium]|nr:hydroxymethylbilane synthase [Deltaproteobacteria bacterium]